MNEPFCKFTKMGLVFDDKAAPDFEDWQKLAPSLGQAGRCINFAIGDWINYGKAKYGKKYEQAMKLLGIAYQTAANYSYIAHAIPISLRKENLDFNHHALVASLEHDAQKKWLDLCEQEQDADRHVSVTRLARSIECGQLVAPKDAAAVNEDKGIPSYILQITRLRSWLRQTKELGRFDTLTERQRQAMREDFGILEEIRMELIELDVWPGAALVGS